MKKITLIATLIATLATFSNAGKVTWDSNGKAHIEASDKPVKGCNGGDDNRNDNNETVKGCQQVDNGDIIEQVGFQIQL